MNWDNFLKQMKEDINKPSVSRRGKKTSIIKRISEDFNDEQLEEKVGDVIKKVGSTITKGRRKLTSKIREVANRGFKFGIGIAKTVAGKFIMFNKNGDLLIPPADKLEYAKAPFGQTVLTAEYNTKVGKMPVYLSDNLEFGFAAKIDGPHGFGIMHVVDPKSKPVSEGKDYKLSKKLKKILKEEEDDEYDEDDLKSKFEADVNKLVFSGGTTALEKTEDKIDKIRPVNVNYHHFKKMLSEMITRVKSGKTIKEGMIKNIAIYAPTGWGKSQIIKSAAEDHGFHFLPLELQKIPLEIIQGFPYLDKVEGADDDTKSERMRVAQVIVKQAPSQYLPPTGDVDNWLLFFDEYNRADTEKMAAVMNLMLTGELGGAAEMVKKGGKITKIEKYRLPKKIVIVMAMNTSEQKGIYEDINAVNNLDIATLERIQNVVFGKYHAASWSDSFAAKKTMIEFEDGQVLPVLSRISPIILNYINKLTKGDREEDVDPMEAPFLLPVSVAGGKGGGGSRTMSPRAWTMVADDMIEMGYDNFSKLSDEQKEKLKPEAETVMKQFLASGNKVNTTKGKKVDPPKDVNQYLFAAYMSDSQVQVSLMSLQSPHFGDGGNDIVYDIIRDYKKKLKEGVSHYDILFNYKEVRPIVKKNFANLGFGTMPRFLAQLLYSLSTFKDVNEIKAFMDKNKWKILETVDSIEEQLLKTFQAIKKDLDIPDDDFASFLFLIDKYAKKGHSVIRRIHQKAVGEGWGAYEEALKLGLKTKSQVEKELESLFDVEKSSKKESETKSKSKAKAKKKEESMDMFNFFRLLENGGVK